MKSGFLHSGKLSQLDLLGFLRLDLLDVELEFLAFEDVSVSTTALAWAR